MKMTRREVIAEVLAGGRPPYVPWSFDFTVEARDRLAGHYGTADLAGRLGNHLLLLGAVTGVFEDLGGNRVRDAFGVVWDRSVDRDIGLVVNQPLDRPDLDRLRVPDPLSAPFFRDMPGLIAARPDCYRVFAIGFSLYERAWTLRGMENLMLDFIERPDFVRALLRLIADYNIALVGEALRHDIDAVYFGDDWGQQRGLQMGPDTWRRFIRPELKRMYGAVRDGRRRVMIHSCGDVDELFDDLVAIGLDCFNPFQPEVMDVPALLEKYRGRLAFYGGLSTQRTLPRESPGRVRAETRRLIELGRSGGLILAPAHAVEGDVPLENMLAFIEETLGQPGAPVPA